MNILLTGIQTITRRAKVCLFLRYPDQLHADPEPFIVFVAFLWCCILLVLRLKVHSTVNLGSTEKDRFVGLVFRQSRGKASSVRQGYSLPLRYSLKRALSRVGADPNGHNLVSWTSLREVRAQSAASVCPVLTSARNLCFM